MNLRAAVTILATLLLVAGRLHAITWVGSGGTGDVFDPANWSGPFLNNGTETLNFGATGRTDPDFGNGNATVASINFTGTSQAYVFSGVGHTLTLNGTIGVNNGSSPITFGSSMQLSLAAGVHEIYVTGSSTVLNFNSDIVGAGSFEKWDDGTAFLYGTGNTYTGGTTVRQGTLTLDGGHVSHSSAATVVGDATTENGTLNVLSGGYLFNAAGSIGAQSGSTGNVVVDGATSTWLNTSLRVGDAGTGTLSVTDGGHVTNSNTYIGYSAGGSGTLAISGAGSVLTNSTALEVGRSGNGTLTISDGASVTTSSAVFGEQALSTGTVDVHGAGSSLNVTGFNLYVGNGGNGIFYLYDQAQVNVWSGSGILTLGHSTGGAGILKIGTDGTSSFAGGIVNAATITTGPGISGELKFVTTATAANPYYLTRDGTAGGTAVVIAGPTQVQQNNGYTVLTGANTYTGATLIDGGTLVAGANSAFGSSTVTVQNGASLALAGGVSFSNTLNFGVGGGTLAGDGTFTGPLTLGSGGVNLAPGLVGPGSLNFATGLTANDGLAATIEIRAPSGTAGTDWDVIDVTGTFDLTPLNSAGFTLKVISLTLANTPGAVSGLSGPTSWDIAIATTLTGFNAADFTIDSSQFTGGGIFSLSAPGNNLILSFTPVPEPSTYALLALGLASTGLAAWRKRRQCSRDR